MTYLSPNSIQDQLVIHIVSNQSLFRQSNSPFAFLNGTTLLKTKIMKQMNSSSFSKNVEIGAVYIKYSVFIALIFNFGLKSLNVNFLAASLAINMDHLISLIHSLHFSFHLPIMNIVL